MGIHKKEGLFLFKKMLHQQCQNRMFKDIGMIAGMKAVAITQHGA